MERFEREIDARGWRKTLEIQPRAMVLSENVLFVAGWQDSVEAYFENSKPFVGKRDETQKPVMMALSAEDGELLKEFSVNAFPVFDGMIAAENKLFLSLQNGRLVCYE